MRKHYCSMFYLYTIGLTGMSVNASYTSKGSWDILVVPEAPQLPSQHRTYTLSIPAYSGGYQTYCSAISGSNNRKVTVSSSVANFDITTTGYSAIYKSGTGGTIKFTFTGVGDKIVANGSLGYDM
ncbi:MAG: hypothetical protein ACI4UK_03865 [Floccifex sp.]